MMATCETCAKRPDSLFNGRGLNSNKRERVLRTALQYTETTTLTRPVSPYLTTKMPKCPSCNKEVYFAEKVSSIGKDWHRPCLKCAKCSKTLSPGSHAENDGKPYCHKPCYAAMFGPGGFGHGGTESHKY